jgi:uncharacterized membrane protein YcaP (DUF421 family)
MTSRNISYSNFRLELIAEEELLSQLRPQRVQSLAEVKRCYPEGNGHFSVIANQSKKHCQRKAEAQLPEYLSLGKSGCRSLGLRG